MNYQTFPPHPDLAALIKCYWILQVPADIDAPRQRIIPDGCIEMIFTLGEDIKRYTSEEDFIIQPRAMILGQTIEPFFIQPTGRVETFAIRFYPYGFANFANAPIISLANKETPIAQLFGDKPAGELEQSIIAAKDTQGRIEIIEDFLNTKLKEQSTIDNIVKSTVDAIFQSKGSKSIHAILKDELPKRRNLERKFLKQVGISPKQLGKVIRLQTALTMILSEQRESLTQIAYDSDYYDQSHFIKDFKEFTGTNPKEFSKDQQHILSSLFYSGD
ncbi:MAG: AraC family transcriptional regulator [Calditrichia bacterium]